MQVASAVVRCGSELGGASKRGGLASQEEQSFLKYQAKYCLRACASSSSRVVAKQLCYRGGEALKYQAC